MNLLTPFLIGLFSSVHCLAMCGGLCGFFVQNNPSIQSIFIINIGRILTYTILGIIVSGLVQGLILQIPVAIIGFWIRSFLGLMLMFLGIRILLNKSNLHSFFSNNYLWQKAKSKLQSVNNKKSFLAHIAKGLLWGLIPCGLLYGVLIAAASTQNVINGGLFMLAFGVGTLPSMLVATGTMKKFQNKLHFKSVRYGAGFFILVIGIWSFISPWFSYELIPNHPVYTSIVAFLDSCVP